MLLIHQTGSVKIGEVVRYTVTYHPSQDRILPSPEKLYLRIRNTSAIALRAAFVHGPYTLCVASYPAGFNPNEKFPNPRRYGVPEFEPMVKAGGSWEGELIVPDDVRQSAGLGSHGGFGKSQEHNEECARWVIEVSSQILFSTSAAVGFEVLVARDKKSLDLGGSVPLTSGQTQVPQPGKLTDHQQSVGAEEGGRHPAQQKGVYSRAVHLKVEDTDALWNTPRAPGWDDVAVAAEDKDKGKGAVENATKTEGGAAAVAAKTEDDKAKRQNPPKKQKKVHLVILTHGLHSNLGADMLFMKESIDAAVKQAKIDAKVRRAKERAAKKEKSDEEGLKENNVDDANNVSDDDDDDEEVLVRGYSGNATKTERGIKYLGKRLARYVLSITYPDQHYLPTGKDVAMHANQTLKDAKAEGDLPTSHKHSTIIHSGRHHDKQQRPYKITSISFIAHSLGGLVQTYAVAYIQKHSPDFFNVIKPINFIALATPFLGLSNENPIYVKFALDFGLVGRTGKDLGLTWRAPTLARSGWGAIVGNLGETAHKKVYGDSQPDSKPLLRILPTGPAHTALKKFRNRTVYSNVVNDGIVPLRTSCLLFLDWSGLGRVEKARRDAGLVETVVGFGWAELMGTSMGHSRQKQSVSQDDQPSDSGTTTPKERMLQVPQPSNDAVEEDGRTSLSSVTTPYSELVPAENGPGGVGGPFSGFFNLFKSNEPPKPEPITQKQKKIYDMSQTLQSTDESTTTVTSTDTEPGRPTLVTTGTELGEDLTGMNAPPRTTVFESAGDLLNPKIPELDYLLDPSLRARTIFHDRVYHPSDIPAPPVRRRESPSVRKRLSRASTWSTQLTSSSNASTPKQDEPRAQGAENGNNTDQTNPRDSVDNSSMRVEEKIARGYHRELSWRKVLVKLEPDAHNNIFVRRMFANAYGWPVVKHIVDAHFSDSATARMRTEDEYLGERALDINQPPDEHGGETKIVSPRTAGFGESSEQNADSEAREALDRVPDLPSSSSQQTAERGQIERRDSVSWSERDWVDSDNESDFDFGGDSKNDKANDNKSKDKPKDRDRGASPSREWNWKEKIVGKGRGKKPSQSSNKGIEKR